MKSECCEKAEQVVLCRLGCYDDFVTTAKQTVSKRFSKNIKICVNEEETKA